MYKGWFRYNVYYFNFESTTKSDFEVLICLLILVSAFWQELAELVHKAHLLCLVARGRLIDKACDDPLIQVGVSYTKIFLFLYSSEFRIIVYYLYKIFTVEFFEVLVDCQSSDLLLLI